MAPREYNDAPAARDRRRRLLALQCWGFMIGASFFAVGSAPGLSESLGADGANRLFFIGAWFFTAAGLIQLFLSSPITTRKRRGRTVRAEWLSAATQSAGTLLFNISTIAALYAQSVRMQDRLVWTPDAGGSAAFLVSGVLACIAYVRVDQIWAPSHTEWWATLINLLGCIAFGVSAMGAYVIADGNAISGSLAGVGTFIGAICFLFAALLTLPRRRLRLAAG